MASYRSMWWAIGLASACLASSDTPGSIKHELSNWDDVDQMIDDFKNVTRMAFSAGDRSGRKHSYAKGKMTMSKRVAMASSSKFPVVLALAKAIADGHVSFDTKVSDVFSWWTGDTLDIRSRVTLKHLMSFTSGMVINSVGSGNISCLGLRGIFYSSEGCARQIYNEAPFEAEPGTTWSYHSLHLQVAAAMVAKATGLSLQSFLKEFALKPLGMQRSFWIGAANPHVAATLVSCGDDYDSLLRKYLAYEAVPKEIADILEADWTAPPVQPSRLEKDKMLLNVFGHYSMGLYFECVANITSSDASGDALETNVGLRWRPECAAQKRHSDPGAFGYWPLIDRSKDFYMQLVAMFVEPYQKGMSIDTWASLPARAIAPLRFSLQQPVERALGKSSEDDKGDGGSLAHGIDMMFQFAKLESELGPLLSPAELKLVEASIGFSDAFSEYTINI